MYDRNVLKNQTLIEYLADMNRKMCATHAVILKTRCLKLKLHNNMYRICSQNEVWLYYNVTNYGTLPDEEDHFSGAKCNSIYVCSCELTWST